MYDFYSEFSSALGDGDVSGANAALMKQLAEILVNNKADFVDMLNESGIDADTDMSDAELIQLFVDNAKNNKKLILAASLLVNVHNKKMGFDGEDEIRTDLAGRGSLADAIRLVMANILAAENTVLASENV